MSKTEYAYTVGEVGTAIKTYNYTYGNAWKDQLTAFDGQSIVYDAVGNPTSYLGNTLTWSKGRLLTNFVSGYTTIANQYDANGIRKTKARINTTPGVVGDIVSTSYFYGTDGKLVKESTNGYTRYYFYNSDGIVGYEENGEKFLYRKNLFGDITAIYKGTTKVAEYVYDAWGNCTITHDVDGYSARNPFRYRGYYFDNDLNMYYLLTRYYDPKIGRFINADTPKYLQPKTINGLNLYAYCNNNPVMNVDPTGHEPVSTYVLMYCLFNLIFIAMYIVAKNTPPKSEDSTDDSKLDVDDEWFDAEFQHPFTLDNDKTWGIGLDFSLWKGIIYIDEENLIYASIGNATAYIGIDLDKGFGIELSVEAAEIGYDGKIFDAGVNGLSAGITYIYKNGAWKFGKGNLLWGWFASIDLLTLFK